MLFNMRTLQSLKTAGQYTRIVASLKSGVRDHISTVLLGTLFLSNHENYEPFHDYVSSPTSLSVERLEWMVQMEHFCHEHCVRKMTELGTIEQRRVYHFLNAFFSWYKSGKTLKERKYAQAFNVARILVINGALIKRLDSIRNALCRMDESSLKLDYGSGGAYEPQSHHSNNPDGDCSSC